MAVSSRKGRRSVPAAPKKRAMHDVKERCKRAMYWGPVNLELSMPTYDYCCTACEHEFEYFQSISSPVKRKCPACGRLKLKRLIGPGAAIMFKGSGFYETDYRSESYKKRAAEEKEAASPSKESKDKSKSDAKGDQAKTEPKTAPKTETTSKQTSSKNSAGNKAGE